MWKNRQYATHRMTYDRNALQIDGKLTPIATADEPGSTSLKMSSDRVLTPPVKNKA